jgi:hypothetical protein
MYNVIMRLGDLLNAKSQEALKAVKKDVTRGWPDEPDYFHKLAKAGVTYGFVFGYERDDGIVCVLPEEKEKPFTGKEGIHLITRSEIQRALLPLRERIGHNRAELLKAIEKTEKYLKQHPAPASLLADMRREASQIRHPKRISAGRLADKIDEYLSQESRLSLWNRWDEWPSATLSDLHESNPDEWVKMNPHYLSQLLNEMRYKLEGTISAIEIDKKEETDDPYYYEKLLEYLKIAKAMQALRPDRSKF